MAAKSRRGKKKLLEALREAPIIEAACKKAGISRATYYRWREDDEFRREADEAIEIGDERVCGIAESKLLGLVHQSNLPAIRFLLNNRSKRYKYPKIVTTTPEIVRPVYLYDMRLQNEENKKPKS